MLSKQILKKILSINSENPPGNEEEIGNYIYDILEVHNYNPKKIFIEDNRANIFLEGVGNLLVVCHMDTVPIGNLEEWNYSAYGEEVNTTIYGRGACDNKGNLSALISALIRVRQDLKIEKTTPHILFTIGEEVDMRGIKHFIENFDLYLENNCLIQNAIVLEPTKNRINNLSKGILKFKVSTKGKAAHGSLPELGDNAIYKISQIIQNFEKYNHELKKNKHRVLGHASTNVGLIQGGNKFNVVPDQCSLEGERRILPNENINSILQEVYKNAKDSHVDIEFVFKPFETISSSKIIKDISKILNELSFDTNLYPFSGISELSILQHDMNVEGVIFGGGDMKYAHTTNEQIEVYDLKKTENILYKIFTQYSSTNNRNNIKR